jgi:hypothetical protein
MAGLAEHVPHQAGGAVTHQALAGPLTAWMSSCLPECNALHFAAHLMAQRWQRVASSGCAVRVCCPTVATSFVTGHTRLEP